MYDGQNSVAERDGYLFWASAPAAFQPSLMPSIKSPKFKMRLAKIKASTIFPPCLNTRLLMSNSFMSVLDYCTKKIGMFIVAHLTNNEQCKLSISIYSSQYRLGSS